MQSAWQHNDVNFESKLGLPLVLQTDHNLEYKQGIYDQLKPCYEKNMLLWDCIQVQLLLVVQDHVLGLFLGLFLGENWVF